MGEVHGPYRAQRVNDDTRPYAIIGQCSWGDEIVRGYLPRWQATLIAAIWNAQDFSERLVAALLKAQSK